MQALTGLCAARSKALPSVHQFNDGRSAGGARLIATASIGYRLPSDGASNPDIEPRLARGGVAVSRSTLRAAIGPGLLLAGAAVGVSHLVQSTRAGAEYGLALLGLVLLACALKFPFLEFGPRYAAATGEHLIRGYARLGRWPLAVFVGLTIATMFIVLAAVTIVTAGLAGTLLGIQASITTLAAGVLGVSAAVLLIGHYRGLDLVMKVIMAVLALATLATVALALSQQADAADLLPSWTDAGLISGAGLAFVLALLGWMPIPLDAAAWHSIWTLERAGETGSRPSVAHAGADFAIGYSGAVVLAVAFMLLGALVMHGGNQ